MSASPPPVGSLRALGERIAREEDAILARPLPPAEATFHPAVGAEKRVAAFRLRVAVVLAASLAVVLLGAVLVLRARPLGVVLSPASAASGGWISAPAEAPVSLRFSEGTEVTLEPETHARLAEVTRLGAHVLLESGAAQVSVTPNRGGRWTFTAGPFEVSVKGTRFHLGWSPREQLFSLTLVEGSVFISGCALGEGRPLFAGETLRASCLTHEFHIDRASTPGSASPSRSQAIAPVPVLSAAPPSAAPAVSPPAPSLDPDESATRPEPPSRASAGRVAHAAATEGGDATWQGLARASRFKEAFARVNERGFDAELGRAGRDDLLLLGDVARLSGDSERAVLAYQRVRSGAPGTDAAANAAFALGRVYFDQRAAYPEAAAWFATYRAERSSGLLARDATGRQMEALSRAGDAVGAARLAEEYLRRYPKGPHAPLARTLHPEAN